MPRKKRLKPPSDLCRRLRWQDVELDYLRELITFARREDLEGLGLTEPAQGSEDISTRGIARDATGTATLIAQTDLIACGLHLIPLIIEAYGGECSCEQKVEEGSQVNQGSPLCSISGTLNVLLQAERVMLNFLQHLSGIATQTMDYVHALGDSPTRLLDTRKTTPGFRVLEKYAVACGGGWNHRMGLFDRVMLKDNHLASLNATHGRQLTKAVETTRLLNPKTIIEVEVDAIEQIEWVVAAGADVILLDNFSIKDLQKAIHLIDGRAYTEASGGITLATLPQLGQLGLDFISCGALVHQSTWKDIGLEIRLKNIDNIKSSQLPESSDIFK